MSTTVPPNLGNEVPASRSPTLAFLCPLYVELKAVKATFDEDLGSEDVEGITCHYGTLSSRETVAIQLPLRHTGPANAATYATTLINSHKSLKSHGSYYFLVGIAGGIWSQRQDVRLGDVVIATTVWDWQAGKITQNGFEHSRHPEDAPKELLRKLPEFLDRRERTGGLIAHRIEIMQQGQAERDDRWDYQGRENDVLFEADYPHTGARTCASCDNQKIVQRDVRSDSLPYVHDGKIASGTVLLKSAEHRAALQQDDVLAVEMEACGVLDPHKFIVVRGISDYADSHKNDIWHGYAAATAAACARLLVEVLLEDDQKQPRSRSSSMSQDRSSLGARPPTEQPEISPDISTLSEPETSASDDPSWAPCFECDAKDIKIEVGDNAEDKTPYAVLHHKAQVLIEVQSHTLLQHKQQRIKIVPVSPKSSSALVLWLPLTNVRVQIGESNVSAQFSNCKQKSKESINHQESYNPIYDSKHPNVHIQLTCTDESEALKPGAFLVQKKQHLITEMSDESYEFPSYTMRNGSVKLSEEDRCKSLFIWDRTDIYQVFNMAFFTSRLDFKLERSGDSSELRLYLLSRLVYECEDIGINTYWPPPEVEANKDGCPSCTKLTENSPSDNAVTLASTTQMLGDLMNATVGYATSSTFMGWYEVDFRPTRRISITSRKSCQLSIWSQDDKLFCLIRSGDRDSQSSNQEWTSWTLTKRNGDDEIVPHLQVSRNLVSLSNLQVMSGDHLSLRPSNLFEAQYSTDAESRQAPRRSDIKISFHDDAGLEDFQKVVAKFVETD